MKMKKKKCKLIKKFYTVFSFFLFLFYIIGFMLNNYFNYSFVRGHVCIFLQKHDALNNTFIYSKIN